MKRKDIITEELNLIQIQIQRMAGNSFIIKGWYVTFMSAFITYMFTQKKIELIYLGIIPIIGCGIYDCYFLYLEKLYREKYNWVIKNINLNIFLFNLNPYEKRMLNKNILWRNIFYSNPIIGFYFLPLITIIFILIF